MRKRSVEEFRPIAKSKIVAQSDRSIELCSSAGQVRLSVLADDLFRLQITSRKKFSARPSWAVEKLDWPAVRVEQKISAQQIEIKTASGKLLFSLQNGTWSFLNAAGQKIFESASVGFDEKKTLVELELAEDESIFGLGETTGTFNKRGLIREFWNTDILGHAPAIHPSMRSLYVSIPFAISFRENRAAGIFWDNPGRQIWDMGQTELNKWKMRAATGEIDLYFFLGPNVQQVVSRFTELTGRMPLPPRWALGYQQCRYSYETQKRVEEIARNFRRRKIPCDAIYLDIHHMDGYRVFTFGKTFPKPARLVRKLAKQGLKVICIVDPGVKNDRKFSVLKNGIASRAFVKAPGGKKDYIGRVWPGDARFPDFLNERTRIWWGNEQKKLSELGIAGFWNDMNEPANFAMPTKTLPEKCVHDSDNGKVTHGEIHNVYGMQMARASRNGILRHQPDTRPFVITRAGYAGVQRHALVWTGDNSSVWEHLSDAVQMFLNLSISGVPFCGGDIGGFIDNTTPELFLRWLQFATFTPFYRNHSNTGTIDQEPWAFGEKVENIARKFIELRYQLLPYLYGLFAEAHRGGSPIMRPLFWHFQNDAVARAVSDQFLLGQNLLVAPILRQGATARSVYLPRGDWFDFWSGEKFSGEQYVVANAALETIPLFARGGTILPMSAVQQFVGENSPQTINLHCWPGAGELDWYDDDGTTLDFQNGKFSSRRISLKWNSSEGTLRLSATKGDYAGNVKSWRIILRNAQKRFAVKCNGKKIASRFDAATKICSFEIPNFPGEIAVKMN
jgi:alpha-glucosidase